MPDVFTGKVLRVISGPTPRSKKTITLTLTWEDGVYKGRSESAPYEQQWFEVVAVVDEEFRGELERKFTKDTEEEAGKIVPGHTYNF